MLPTYSLTLMQNFGEELLFASKFRVHRAQKSLWISVTIIVRSGWVGFSYLVVGHATFNHLGDLVAQLDSHVSECDDIFSC